MSMITVQFKDYGEMVLFARQLLGVEENQPPVSVMRHEQPVQTTPVPPTVPVEQPAQSVQSTPTAPVPPAPVSAPQPTQAAPAPVMAAPVQTAPASGPQPAASVPFPVPAAVPQPAQAAVPVTAPAYTLDDLARAGMTLMDAGRQNDLLSLLAQFGVDSLPALPKGQYGAFATALRGLGAQI